MTEKIIEEFHKEYRLAYDGILPPEMVAKGVPWYENFLLKALSSARADERARIVEAMDYASMSIAAIGTDLCSNSQSFRSEVLKKIEELKVALAQEKEVT